MRGQLRNELGKRAVASSCDAAADEELVAAAKKGNELAFENLAKRQAERELQKKYNESNDGRSKKK
jgi:hypothetical protein